MDYKQAGVDVEAGDALVDWLSQNTAQMPHFDRVVSGIGGFASLFRIDFPDIRRPLLVTCTDGVGTKVKIGAQYSRYFGLGQDLVAMCVNDLICTGARPLLFLDYYATGKLELSAAQEFLTGVRDACRRSNCNLVGGETAEMPGVYQGRDFDCAGFAVGIVDAEKTIGAERVRAGDILVGVASSGFHSNGYSLLRKVFAQDMDEWVDILLAPTALYVELMQELLSQELVQAAAHITGGGVQNIPRVLPTDLAAELEVHDFPEPFLEVQRRTGMTRRQMLDTLNCGLGFQLIVRPEARDRVLRICSRHGFRAWENGRIIPRNDRELVLRGQNLDG